MSRAAVEPLLTPDQRARRDRIVEAGLRLLGDRDFDRIQMKEVADEAGVALGTVYHYFASKEHLFAEVLVRWASTLGASVARRPLQGSTPGEQLVDVLHRSVRAFQRRPHLVRLLATLDQSTDPFAAEVIGRLAETTDRIYEEAVAGLPSARAAAVLRVVGAVMAAALRAWASGRMPIADVYDRVTEAVGLVLPGPA